MTTYNKDGNNNQLQWTENIFKYAHNNQKYHKTKLLTLQKLNYKFKTTKQQLNCWVTDHCNITSYQRKSFAYYKENFICLRTSLLWYVRLHSQYKNNAYAKQIMLNQK